MSGIASDFGDFSSFASLPFVTAPGECDWLDFRACNTAVPERISNMQSLMQSTSRISLATWFASACLFILLTSPASSDVIMDWNAKADAIGVEKQLVNVPNARGQAML